MSDKKILAFDLVDTLCFRPESVENLGVDKYQHCKPIQEMIDISNSLYDKGYIIYIYTARGMKTLDGDIKQIYDVLYPITLESLKKWGIKHHGLIMGKLHYDLLIDDKAVSLEEAQTKLKQL